MKKSLLYIWQLPQNLVALLVLGWVKITCRVQESCVPDFAAGGQRIYYVSGFPGGVSLGRYIFVSNFYLGFSGKTERHEYGHCRQSLRLGWLYLLVIGLPSLVWAAFYRYDKNNPYGYYRFYTERWADKLGGVTREA